MDGLGTTVPKNVFLLITRERVFYKKKKKHYGTKWSFSVKVEPITPNSEFRAEQFSLLCAIWELLYFVPKNVFFLITRERVFYKKKKNITEQNGPLVLKWNQLFRVPNSERNNLVLYVRFGNYYILFLKMCSF